MSVYFKSKENYSIIIILYKIPGIHYKTAKNICKELGVLESTKWGDFTEVQKNNFLFWLNENILKDKRIGPDFNSYQNKVFNNLFLLNCYKSIRHKKKLPVNGQRTRTNAKTSKKLK